MDRLYAENDKIMLLETGQVLTVHEDLSNHLAPGIIVKEKIGRLLHRNEVRPAGSTRQRLEVEKHITEPEPAPPPPENRLKVEMPEESHQPAQAFTEPEPEQNRPARKLYQRGDKIVFKDTGEVLTVLEDFSDREELGIMVKEKIGVIIMSCDVRPAGGTRERLEAGTGITEPEAPPTSPE
jgi:hypothetical protein